MFNQQKQITQNSLVNGLIASGDNKSAIDCTPAINPCAFPCDGIQNRNQYMQGERRQSRIWEFIH